MNHLFNCHKGCFFIKQFTAFLAATLCAAFLIQVPAYAEGASAEIPPAVADSYVVMDADTGQVLLEKNMHKREFPASITKVLTVALGLQNGRMDDSVTVDASAVSSAGSHISLQAGEQVTLRDLSYAAMLPSANDAASAIAVHTGGSLEGFAKLMNDKARELGCMGTNFVNANGMPDDNHYTTAYDMALITKYALTVPDFPIVFGGEEYLMPPTNKQPNQRQWGTDHMMLVTSAYYYEGTLGGKLGWTEDAQHTAVTLVERNGMRLICVVMKDTRYDKFKDSIALYDYCFNNFKPLTISGADWDPIAVQHQLPGGGEETLSVYSDTSYRLLVHKSALPTDLTVTFSVPERYGENEAITPTVHFSVNDSVVGMYHDIGDFPLQYNVASESIATAGPFDKEPVLFGSAVLAKLALAFGTIFGIVLLGFLSMIIVRYVNKYRAWKRRKARIARLKRYNVSTVDVRPPPGAPSRPSRPITSHRRRP